MIEKYMILVFLLIGGYGIGQELETYSVEFEPIFSTLQDDTEITTLKFYVSNVEFYDVNELIYEEDERFYLVEMKDELGMVMDISIPRDIAFNTIHFDIGIDSITNVSGAMGGTLDPMHGMYWSWQSGYINFKLEGRSTLCPTRKNEFQFHIGGYQKPYYPIQTLVFDIVNQESVIIEVNLDELLSNIDLKEQNHIMSPCEEAMNFASLFPFIFKMKQ